MDFGTTNTVAAVGDPNGIRTLTIDGRPVMPSAVLLTKHGWIVGNPALNMSRRQLDCFEATPKRAIADRSLFLGGRDIPVQEGIAEVFKVVTEEASRQNGGKPPATFMITHPATWSQARIGLLQEAAAAATRSLRGWPTPVPMTEPEAAAERTLGIASVSSSSRLVVLDLGGGTVDVTVVDRRDTQLTVVGRPTGRDGLGGEDFDLRLARWMVSEVGAPGLYDRLAGSADPDERERAVEIRTMARAAKEHLSRASFVPALLPKSPPELPESTPVQVSKVQLEELIRGGAGREAGLSEAVALVKDALDTAPPGPPFAGVFLVGGSSRIPLLGTLIVQQVGQVPLTHGDPTTAVADGAAAHAWTALESPSPPGPDLGSAGGSGEGARAGGAPLRPSPPTPDPEPGSRRRPKRRGRLVALSAALTVLLIGGLALAAAWHRSTDQPSYRSSSSYRSSYSYPPSRITPTSPVISTPPTSAASVLSAVRRCMPSSTATCTRIIRDASWQVWPEMAEQVPSVESCRTGRNSGSVYSYCSAGSLEYSVYWRRGTELVADGYRALMPDPSEDEFTISSTGEVLGTSIQGRWSADSGEIWYSCLWEYSDYPVALVIGGHPDDMTTACKSVSVYSGARMNKTLREPLTTE